MLLVDVREEGAIWGEMACAWEESAALKQIEDALRERSRLLIESSEGMERPNKAAVEEKIAEGVRRARELVEEKAPAVLGDARRALVEDVVTQLMSDMKITLSSPEGYEEESTGQERADKSAWKKLRQERERFYRKRNNERMGVRTGRPHKADYTRLREKEALRKKVIDAMLQILNIPEKITQPPVAEILGIGNTKKKDDRTLANKLTAEAHRIHRQNRTIN
jgi:hypothetical protein